MDEHCGVWRVLPFQKTITFFLLFEFCTQQVLVWNPSPASIIEAFHPRLELALQRWFGAHLRKT